MCRGGFGFTPVRHANTMGLRPAAFVRPRRREDAMIHVACLLAALLAAPAPAAPAGPAAGAPPTPGDVRALIDEGEAAEALKQVSRLLALRGPGARGLDRHELLVLKAEAHLRLRAGDAAAQAVKAAAEETGSREHAAVARGTELLIRRSRNLVYTPKKAPAGKRDPIDIVDPEKRRAALRAMFADEMAELAPRLRAARAARTLPPALKAMEAARALAPLELAANGSADQSNAAADELKQSAKELLAKALEKATRRVDQITDMANDLERVRRVFPDIGGGYNVEIAQRRRGLKRQDIADLKALADTCDEVAAGGKAVAKAAGVEEAEFEELINSAEDLRMHIRRMLRAQDVDY